jgi:hypothetical protein
VGLIPAGMDTEQDINSLEKFVIQTVSQFKNMKKFEKISHLRP